THYMEEAQYLCDRIYMLHKGTIIAQGTPASLMKETHTDNLRNAFMQLIKGETNHGTGIV
ncbi:MAG: ABC transporter ATP-binding protein, partial [Lachnospiraceae bacterium]|nr:ABC transporter ATP-binding protein [Lachnospiraceae bacterium]